MRVVSCIRDVGPELSGGVLTIGNFDGVHVGHRSILRRASQLAREVGGPLVVMTFEPHPVAILRPDRKPATLTPRREKLAQLENAGADAVVIAEVDHEFLAMTAEAFVRDIVAGLFRPRWVVEGPTFNYGRDRQGNNDALRAAGREYGFEVCVVEPSQIETGPGRREMVSSSLVRRAVAAGDVELAARALGRPYALVGNVIEGRRRGRQLGFPTANLDVGGQLVPADGVYAGSARVAGAEYIAAVSIGCAPTFEATDRLVEAYLLDFDGDIYGEWARVEVRTRIRGQETYTSVEELCRQIERDVAVVRAVMTGSTQEAQQAPA